jgi:hypothetical protein
VEESMTLYPKNLLLFVVFMAVLFLAVGARAGSISPSLAWVGIGGIVAVEAFLCLGIFTGRRRHSN